MEFTLTQIAKILNGKVEGIADAKIIRLCKIEEGCSGGLSFLANLQYASHIYETEATAVIVAHDFIPERPVSTNLIRVENPYQAFAKLLEAYNEIKSNRSGISPMAFIGKNVELGENVYVGEFAVIEEGVKIGNGVKIYPQSFVGENTHIKEGTIIYAGVKIYSDNQIGKNCIIHAGAVIGADGFGFAPNTGKYEKVAQIGNVILQDYVEIGANTCIDRATLGSTVIEEGVKLDNLIQIAHNVVVGKHTVMASQVGIAGSTKIGANCMFGGQVGIAGHAHIAKGVMLAAQTGVASSITKENSILMGSPSMDASEYKRAFVYFRHLAKLANRIDELEKKLNGKN